MLCLPKQRTRHGNGISILLLVVQTMQCEALYPKLPYISLEVHETFWDGFIYSE